MNFKTKKLLAIAVDCGFDSVKIDINNHLYSFPSYIIQDEGDSESLGSSDIDDIVYSETLGGRRYLVGSMAKTKINNYPENGPHFDEINKLKNLDEFFHSENAIRLIRCAIAYAIVKYEQDNEIGFTAKELDKYTIHLELPLPHSIRNAALGYLSGPLSTSTSIDLSLNKKTYSLNLKISKANIYGASQVLSAFYNYILNEDGTFMQASVSMPNLPAIVIDGGYRTQGIATIKNNGTLIVENAESKKDFSMIEVNNKVVDTINSSLKEKYNLTDDYNPIREYDIDTYIASGTNFAFDVKDDTNDLGKHRECVKFSEIKQVKDDVLNQTAKDYCKFLINDYGIGNANTIIIAGGTGAAYAEQIKKSINSYDPSIDIRIVNDKYCGSEVSPAFAVVIGSHKNLLRILITRE